MTTYAGTRLVIDSAGCYGAEDGISSCTAESDCTLCPTGADCGCRYSAYVGGTTYTSGIGQCWWHMPTGCANGTSCYDAGGLGEGDPPGCYPDT